MFVLVALILAILKILSLNPDIPALLAISVLRVLLDKVLVLWGLLTLNSKELV